MRDCMKALLAQYFYSFRHNLSSDGDMGKKRMQGVDNFAQSFERRRGEITHTLVDTEPAILLKAVLVIRQQMNDGWPVE